MGFFGNNKDAQGIHGEDGLPNMKAEPQTLADTLKATKKGDKALLEQETVIKDAAENEGLPSVNRRKGNNKLVTILGFIFILGAAGALIVAVNSDKTPKKKKVQEDEISNNLPHFTKPPPPPVIKLAPTPIQAQAPAIKPGAQPIALKAGPNGKPLPDWTDRKMGGTLLVGQQANGAGPASQPPYATATVQPAGENDGTIAFAGGTGRQPGTQTGLAVLLEPSLTKGVSASMLPDRNYLITKGTTLDCALETALDSTVPGLTTCRLTRDVYSDNGHVLLLDRGSQLVGEYQGGLKQGQVRLFVLWTRAKTPNGVVISLNSPGTDALGRSGLEGWVDNHFIERFGAAILMSFIKDTVTALVNQKTNSSGNSGGTTVYSGGGAATGGEKIVEKILESTVNIPPTMIKNQGDYIQVMVARDLDFSGVYDLKVARQ